MEKVISIGKQIEKQNFASLRENHYFFVDEYEHAGLLFL